MKDKQLCIFACDNFASEIAQVVEEEGYREVVVKPIEVNCNGPLLKFKELEEVLASCKKKYHKVIVLGSSCFRGMNPEIRNDESIDYYHFNHCFEMVMAPRLVEHYISQRNYLVSPGWFKAYEQNLKNWGFEAAHAKDFFRENSTKIVYLDTGVPLEKPELLEELGEYMGLPVESLPVGLDYVREKVRSLVFEWRYQLEKKILKHELALSSSKTADYSMVFNELNNLLGLTEEAQLFDRVFIFLQSIYAPENIAYFPTEGAVKWLSDDNEILPDTRNYFTIPLSLGEDALGEIRIYNVQFPQHVDRYRDLVSVVGKMIALTLSNVRKYAVILNNEKLLKQKSSDLQQSIQVRDRFFSIVAHDLRSPFNSILGLSNVLVEDFEELQPSTKLSFLEKLNQSANNYFQLLENLLEWSSTQSGGVKFKPDLFNMHVLTEEVIELFEIACRLKGIRLASYIPKDFEIYGDTNMIRTILRNLISNAMKFTPSGGKIYLELNNLNTAIPGFQWFCLKDTGVGMTNKQLDKLFSEEEKVHTKGTESEPGSGLGLLLVSEMISYHGGKLEVKSQINSGTCFSFALPLSSEFLAE